MMQPTLSTPTKSLRLSQQEQGSYRSGEFGLIGAEEADESLYDSRRGGNSGLLHHQQIRIDGGDNSDTEQDENAEIDNGCNLVFDTDRLYGREDELKQLETLYNDYLQQRPADDEEETSTEQPPCCAVVLLEGHSGVGKTALVQHFIRNQQTQDTRPFHFWQGKYEQTEDTISFLGIANAMEAWVKGLTIRQRETLWKQHHLHEVFKDYEDRQLLLQICPSLESLFCDVEKQQSTANNSSQSNPTTTTSPPVSPGQTSRNSLVRDSMTVNKTRLHSSFSRLLQCLTRTTTLVCFLDDLQWADASSLELLQAAISTQSPGGAFFILAARVEQSPHHPAWSHMHEALVQQSNDNPPAAAILTIKDLTESATARFIADTLQLEESSDVDVMPLTKAIYRRSLGNIFFTKQTMEQLVRKGILYFDMVYFCWQWRSDKLSDFSNDAEQDEGDNVLKMVKGRLASLPDLLQTVLFVAAHTRSRFEAATLLPLVRSVLETDYNTTSAEEQHSAAKEQSAMSIIDLFSQLDRAVREGLLTKIAKRADGNTGEDTFDTAAETFVFSHDRIQEAARCLVADPIARENKLFLLGQALAQLARTQAESWMMFGTINHLGAFPVDRFDGPGRLQLAHLHLEVARLSLNRAAFGDAAKYAIQGIRYVKWDNHRDLAHNLHLLAAEASRLNGDLDAMERYCNICLKAERDPQEKIRVCYILANGLFYGSNRREEAKVMFLDMLHDLGCRFPRTTAGRKVEVAQKLLALLASKQKWRPGELGKVDFMKDRCKIQAMKLLDKFLEVCYITNDEELLPLLIFRALEYTVRHGICPYTPRLIASISIVLIGAVNDIQGGGLYANYALETLKRVHHKSIVARSALIIYGFGLSWTLPVRQHLQPLREAYAIGMHTGDVENAHFCIFYAIFLSLQCGVPLPGITDELERHLLKAEEMGNWFVAACLKGLWVCTLELMGGSKESSAIGDEDREITNQLAIESIGAFERIKLGYLGDYKECAASAMESKGSYHRIAAAAPIPPMDMFVSALSCLEMGRQTGKKEYITEAKRIRKWIVGWAKRGNPNVQHWKSLLDAEFAGLRGRSKAALGHFRRAADLADSMGDKLTGATVYERWATFALEESNGVDEECEAYTQIEYSLRRCADIGAMGKIRRLKSRFPNAACRESRKNNSQDTK